MSQTPSKPRRSPRLKSNCYNEDAQWNAIKHSTEADDTSLFSREDDSNVEDNTTIPVQNETTMEGTNETQLQSETNRCEFMPGLGTTDQHGNTVVVDPPTVSINGKTSHNLPPLIPNHTEINAEESLYNQCASAEYQSAIEEDNGSEYLSANEDSSNVGVSSNRKEHVLEERIVNIKQEDVDDVQDYRHCDGIHPALRSRQVAIKQEENLEIQHDGYGEQTTENEDEVDSSNQQLSMNSIANVDVDAQDTQIVQEECSKGNVNDDGEHTTGNGDEVEVSRQQSSLDNRMVATLSKRKCDSKELKQFLKEKGQKCGKPKQVCFDVSVILKGVDPSEISNDESLPISSPPKKKGRKRKLEKNETEAEVECKPSKKRGKKSNSNSTSEKKVVGQFYSSGLQFDGLELLDKVDPPDSNTFPKTEFCKWSFNENTRVLLGSFDSKRIKEAKIKQDNFCLDEDMSFLLRMMERTDFAVITEGLFNEPRDEYLWDPVFIEARIGDNVFHRFRMFEKNQFNQNEIDELRINGSSLEDFQKSSEEGGLSKSFELFTEVNGDISMRIRDFLEICKVQENLDDPNVDHIVKYKNLKGGDEEFDAKNKTLYMIDFDLKGMLPETYDDFMKKFLFPELLPGGSACMMHSVNSNGRPFMGPNFYQTFPGSFTHFHQDGYGTVDSGHLCLEGYNEVVMLRRMDDDHKRHALSILQCVDGRKKRGPEAFDALYGLPHHNNTKPLWPTKSAIAECDDYNYSPCVFILKPGQMLHINKGRLHAFRKMSYKALEQNDCHQEVRKSVVEENNITSEVKCTSVAWDWMYLGTTLEGIKAEVSQTVNSAKLARDNLKQSLAIPQVSIVERVKYELAQFKIASARGDHATVENSIKILTALQGSLRKLFGDQIELFKIASNGGIYKDQHRKLIIKPNADAHEKITSIDPFGNDFFCSLCFQELGNIYMHCEGCEELLQKDYNLCAGCYSDEGRFLSGFQMNAFLSIEKIQGRRTDYNHYPDKKHFRSNCPCKNGPMCRRCRLRTCCSCRCHAEYSLHYRFYDQNAMENILKDVEQTLNQSGTRSMHA
ncbi:hypothetical protein CTEN210_13103 [Chaetoceros tenuissimus]|uniref:JmjC domain-containing protein n=1 Tax=Chaetoceros tenuissimus TaxID=426638 RepID=A0AAD3HAG6_9STRA|nr:hypothetical protein CTEN210_13103 [Chaetoceros tenuissimus]